MLAWSTLHKMKYTLHGLCQVSVWYFASNWFVWSGSWQTPCNYTGVIFCFTLLRFGRVDISHILPGYFSWHWGTLQPRASIHVSPQDLLNTRSREIWCYNDCTAVKFDRRIGSAAVEVPVKFQSNRESLNLNLLASRLHEFSRLGVSSPVNRGLGQYEYIIQIDLQDLWIIGDWKKMAVSSRLHFKSRNKSVVLWSKSNWSSK